MSEFMRACQPCGGLDATPDTALVVKGRCQHCGDNGLTTEGVNLYRVPKRPAPGLTKRMEATR